VGPPLLCGGDLLTDLAPGAPEIRIERRFGPRGAPRAEEDALLWREGLAVAHPQAALAEAEERVHAVLHETDPRRVDRRAVPFVTVDPATAEDHDDALFAQPLADGGTRAFVAIADVSAFVPAGGALDLEARRRGTSIYLPGRVVPMLPPILSNHAASLVPGEDRPAMVLELDLDAEARVRSHRVELATIRSRAKLTYEEASAVLGDDDATKSNPAAAHGDALRVLDRLAQRLRERRRERGAIAVDAPEVIVETDAATGLPLRIHRAENDPRLSRAHQLVEELMLLANETIAGSLHDRQARALFRVHDAPSDARAMRLVEAARRQGIELDASIALDATTLRDLLRRTSDPALRDALSALLLGAMPGALYATHRQDHFALASDHYVHFTSPIRRYADLTIHRAIRAMATGEPAAADEVDPLELNRIQQRARAIQREVGDLYAALLMSDRVGQTYVGTIVRVLKRQWVVALDAPAVGVRCLAPAAGFEEGARVEMRIEDVSIARRTILAAFVSSPERRDLPG
jgi:ribonuclease R